MSMNPFDAFERIRQLSDTEAARLYRLQQATALIIITRRDTNSE